MNTVFWERILLLMLIVILNPARLRPGHRGLGGLDAGMQAPFPAGLLESSGAGTPAPLRGRGTCYWGWGQSGFPQLFWASETFGFTRPAALG